MVNSGICATGTTGKGRTAAAIIFIFTLMGFRLLYFIVVGAIIDYTTGSNGEQPKIKGQYVAANLHQKQKYKFNPVRPRILSESILA